MTILENLWYGNIRPVEEFVDGNAKYKNSLRIVAKNRERLEETLSPEQTEPFEKYCTAVNEMNSIYETAAFKYGYCLAIELFSELTT